MFTLRQAAARAVAIASRRAPLISTTTVSRQFSIIAPRAFARTWVVRNTEKPLEPLEDTAKPGVESGVTLESEEKLAQALENPAPEATEAEVLSASDTLEAIEAKREEAKKIHEERQRSLFVQNLSWDVTEESIREDFGAFGAVTNVFRAGGRASWCIITFEKAEDMQEASKQVNGTFWHGRRITAIPRRLDENFSSSSPREPVARREKPKRDPSPYLYVGNMPYDISDAELTDLFDSVANATGVRIATDSATGMPRGYAHVDFRSVADAQAAAEILGEKVLRGRQIAVDFATKRVQRDNRRPRPPVNKERGNDWNSRN